MSLSYHFSFLAAASTSSAEIAEFLRGIEGDARLMGFNPTIVVDAPFDSPERRDFARRTSRPLTVNDPRLREADLPEHLYWTFLRETGVCRLAPEHGVFLVVTNERGVEIVFGFCRYPRVIRDRAGREIMSVEAANVWRFDGFVDSPDPRFRAIVRRFRDAGFVASENDEFAPARSQ